MNQNNAVCENAAIQVNNVHKSFGKVKALSGIDIQVDSGIVFVLLGPNGSGKNNADPHSYDASQAGFGNC